MSGLLITFEGIDFCGKSVQSKLLFERFQKYFGDNGNDRILLLREPGGTEISEKVRDILLDRSLKMMNSVTELLLYESARSQLIAEIILPALQEGLIVICDRFYDSTTAYQGYGRGIQLETIKTAHKIATHGIRPDVTFIIDLDPTIARSRQKNAGRLRDRMELEELAFHKKVREGYCEIAKDESDRVFLIEGDRPIKEISENIWEIISTRLAQNN
jgi:dTMP kinase